MYRFVGRVTAAETPKLISPRVPLPRAGIGLCQGAPAELPLLPLGVDCTSLCLYDPWGVWGMAGTYPIPPLFLTPPICVARYDWSEDEEQQVPRRRQGDQWEGNAATPHKGHCHPGGAGK